MITIREATIKYKSPKKAELPFSSSDGVASFVRKITKGEAREHFITIYCDQAYQPIAYAINHIGSANMCTVSPLTILQPAVHLGALAIVLSHNHPSGNLKESPEDIKVTEQLVTAAKTLGIKVLDHVIVSDHDHKSLRTDGCVIFN